jgi:hypothetical protein
MPTSKSPEARLTDAAVHAAVIRLARPDGAGGAVIERAAIVAEGTPAAAIEAWVIAHGGEPEALTSAIHAPGVHGSRRDGTRIADRRPPRRYVLPAAALVARPGGDDGGAETSTPRRLAANPEPS